MMKKVCSMFLAAVLLAAACSLPASAVSADLTRYQEIVDEINRDYGLEFSLTEGVLPEVTPEEFKEQALAAAVQQQAVTQKIANMQGEEESPISVLATGYDVSRKKKIDGTYYISCVYNCLPGTPNIVRNVRSVQGGVLIPQLNGIIFQQTGCDVKYLDSHRTAAIAVYGTWTQGILTIDNFKLYEEFGFVPRGTT